MPRVPTSFRLPKEVITITDDIVTIAKRIGLRYPSNRTDTIIEAIDHYSKYIKKLERRRSCT